jgi:LysM repeat protein
MKTKLYSAVLVIVFFFVLTSQAVAFKPAGEEIVGKPTFNTTAPAPIVKYVRVPYPVVAPKTVDQEKYTVVKGENLTKIAKDHGTTVEVLRAINPKIKNQNKIKAGQVLQVPKPYNLTVEGKLVAVNAKLDSDWRAAEQKADSVAADNKVLTADLKVANNKFDNFYPIFIAALLVALTLGVVVVVLGVMAFRSGGLDFVTNEARYAFYMPKGEGGISIAPFVQDDGSHFVQSLGHARVAIEPYFARQIAGETVPEIPRARDAGYLVILERIDVSSYQASATASAAA